MSSDEKKQARGSFILFEGLDRTGKTTQSVALVEHLKAQGHSAIHMRFPDRTTAVGKMIDSYLRNESELDDRAVHLLFSANRWERSCMLQKALESGTHVVCDRYSYSGVAFTAAKGIDVDWCLAPEKGLPAPDVVMYLTLSLEEAQKRGNYGEERYEKKEVQMKVRQMFDKLKTETWKELDAGRSVEAIAADIQQLANTTIAEAADKPIRTI